jgi:hypothetical protein
MLLNICDDQWLLFNYKGFCLWYIVEQIGWVLLQPSVGSCSRESTVSVLVVTNSKIKKGKKYGKINWLSCICAKLPNFKK